MANIELLRSLLSLSPNNRNQIIIDGGCNIGQFSRELIKIFPEAMIFAYEPDPASFKTAQNNLQSIENIKVIEAALGESVTRAKLYRGPFPATNSLSPRPTNSNNTKPYYPSKATLEEGADVDVITLDSEASLNHFNFVNLLKLDLQGGELAALAGAKQLLEKGLIEVIFTEAVFVKKYQDQPLLWKLWQYLESYQYSLYSLEDIKIGDYEAANKSLRDHQWNQCDAIFVSNKIRSIIDRQ